MIAALYAEPAPTNRAQRKWRAESWLRTWKEAGYTRADILSILGIAWLSDWDWTRSDAEEAADAAINAYLATLEVKP